MHLQKSHSPTRGVQARMPCATWLHIWQIHGSASGMHAYLAVDVHLSVDFASQGGVRISETPDRSGEARVSSAEPSRVIMISEMLAEFRVPNRISGHSEEPLNFWKFPCCSQVRKLSMCNMPQSIASLAPWPWCIVPLCGLVVLACASHSRIVACEYETNAERNVCSCFGGGRACSSAVGLQVSSIRGWS